MHALIVGARHVGKSTLIGRVLRELHRPVVGFETKRETQLAGSPIYIYEPGKPRTQSQDNLVGFCENQNPIVRQAGFDDYAPKLLEPIPAGSLVLMDEIGFLEAGSQAFCSAIFHLLDGSVPVIAAVKDKDFPFLQAVRAHPNARCFYITEENRDALYEEVLAFLKGQL